MLALLTGTTACGGNNNQNATQPPVATTTQATTAPAATTAATTAAEPEKPETWIADRSVIVQAYVDDIGYSMPENQKDNPVFQELKKRTGIDLVIQYTPGDDDSAVMATQLASGVIPDVIISYLNDSTRPEFPILLRAARDGMFADLSPYFKDSKVYTKYLENGYLPNDSAKNIVFRDEFNGAVYLPHLAIDRVDQSLNWRPDIDLRGGMYIQAKIAGDLGIDVKSIQSQEQLYDLLVKIKAADYKDDNGNTMVPLGPKYWGGSVDALSFVLRGFDWGVSDGYNLMNGKVMHESQTEYAMQKVLYFRKLLDEKLVNPEFFTMDTTRANEFYLNHSAAIMGDCHNYIEIIYSTDNWIPLGPLADYNGNTADVRTGKTCYGCWAVSAKADKPGEIFALFDYLTTKEGKLLGQYGIEGLSYDMAGGKPILNARFQALLDDGDSDALINEVGAAFGGAGFVFFDYMLTDIDPVADFGESRPGAGTATTFERAVQISTEYPQTRRLVQGLNATAYLTDESLTDVKAQLDLMDYKETLTQAMFAGSDDEAQKIMDSFRLQMENAGLEKFTSLVQGIYENDNNAVKFY